MRKTLALLITASALALFAQPSSAEIVDIGKHSAGDVRKACDAAGGSFQYVKNQGGQIDYTCVKHDCDGNGGICQVYCDHKEQCKGSTPGRTAPPSGRFDFVRILKLAPTRPPGPGLLQPTPEASPHGPSGPGTPKPAMPPAGKFY